MANKYREKSIFNSFRLLKYLFRKPVTHELKNIVTKKNANYLASQGIMKKSEVEDSSPRLAPPNLRGFHTNDWEECIGCGTCGEICPTDAITMVERLEIPERPGEFQVRPAIDYGRCCFCALCVDTCTTGSLNMSTEYVYANDDPDKFYFLPDELWRGEAVKHGWQKDENSDLLDLERVPMEHIEPDERKDSFVEIVRGYSKEYAKQEAARCVECGVCESSCPVQMHIPAYIRSIWEDDIDGALRQVYETNPLPGVCGRVCTHNCETSCAIAVRGEAIAIRWLKRYIIDSAPDDIYHQSVMDPVNEVIDAKVAIVGSGPASLGAAYYLRTMGYQVTVFEQKALAGGVMRYGIPAYRLPDTAIDKDINFIKSIGVDIKLNTRVGKDVTFNQLEKDYDAVFLGSGFFTARKLNIPGADHKDVMGALDFLPLVRDFERGVLKLEDINVKPSVIVIGAGDVAFDVARSTIRLQMLKYGKADVKLTSLETLDILPASQDEYLEGLEEGIEFYCGNGPQKVIIEDDKIKGLLVWKCLCVFDDEGRFNPKFDECTKTIIEAEQVFMAVGQAPDYSYISEDVQSGIEIVRGKIKAAQDGQVEAYPWLFIGGDINRGPDLISGVADGHRAAQAIDDYLYQNAKQKQSFDKLEEIRNVVKSNTPVLTPKQRGLPPRKKGKQA
ncbi:MAG: FAD-dependent oxidoreductase [Acholeplasmataceae bacterium]